MTYVYDFTIGLYFSNHRINSYFTLTLYTFRYFISDITPYRKVIKSLSICPSESIPFLFYLNFNFTKGDFFVLLEEVVTATSTTTSQYEKISLAPIPKQ